MGRKRKEDQQDIEVFKTTIGFRGLAKDFILELGNNKSAIINSLIIGAIKDGTMKEQLIRVLTAERVKFLEDKYKIGYQQCPVKESDVGLTTIKTKGEEKNGFDF